MPVSITDSYFTFNNIDVLSFNIDENNSEIVNITLYEYSSLIHNISYNNSSYFKFFENNFTISFGKEIGQQSFIYGARRKTTITETVMPITVYDDFIIYYDTNMISGLSNYDNTFSLSINESFVCYDSLMLSLETQNDNFIYSFYTIYTGYDIFSILTLTRVYSSETSTLTFVHCNISSLNLEYNISDVNNLSINAYNVCNQAYTNINNLDLKCKSLFNDFTNIDLNKYTYTVDLNTSLDKTLYSGIITYRNTYSNILGTSEEFLTKMINTIYTNSSELTNYKYISDSTKFTTKFEIDTINSSMVNELIEMIETIVPATIRCSCTDTINTSCSMLFSIYDSINSNIMTSSLIMETNIFNNVGYRRALCTYSFSNHRHF